jgi:hypothetical protein
MEYEYKYRFTLNFINSPTQKERKFGNLGNKEMDLKFPPDEEIPMT